MSEARWRNIAFTAELPAGADFFGYAGEVALLTSTNGWFKVWMNENLGLINHSTFLDGIALLNSLIMNPVMVVKGYALIVFFISSLAVYVQVEFPNRVERLFTYH